MKNVIAVIREETVEEVISALRSGGIGGATVIPAKGYGEYANSFARVPIETYAKVEVMIESEQAEAVARLIMETAHSGTEGDGIVAIAPLDGFFRIRDRWAAHPSGG